MKLLSRNKVTVDVFKNTCIRRRSCRDRFRVNKKMGLDERRFFELKSWIVNARKVCQWCSFMQAFKTLLGSFYSRKDPFSIQVAITIGCWDLNYFQTLCRSNVEWMNRSVKWKTFHWIIVYKVLFEVDSRNCQCGNVEKCALSKSSLKLLKEKLGISHIYIYI